MSSEASLAYKTLAEDDKGVAKGIVQRGRKLAVKGVRCWPCCATPPMMQSMTMTASDIAGEWTAPGGVTTEFWKCGHERCGCGKQVIGGCCIRPWCHFRVYGNWWCGFGSNCFYFTDRDTYQEYCPWCCVVMIEPPAQRIGGKAKNSTWEGL